MKKLIYVIFTIVSVLTLCSCQSNEDKVKQLVYEDLKPIIYDIDLYTIEVQESPDPDEIYIYYVYFQDITGDCSGCMKYRYFESSNKIFYQEDCDCLNKR